MRCCQRAKSIPLHVHTKAAASHIAKININIISQLRLTARMDYTDYTNTLRAGAVSEWHATFHSASRTRFWFLSNRMQEYYFNRCSVTHTHTHTLVCCPFADMPIVSLKMGASLNPDYIKEGDSVYFECNTTSNPKPYKMTWYQNVSISGPDSLSHTHSHSQIHACVFACSYRPN